MTFNLDSGVVWALLPDRGCALITNEKARAIFKRPRADEQQSIAVLSSMLPIRLHYMQKQFYPCAF